MKDLINKDKKEVIEFLHFANKNFRIIKEDDINYMTSCDLQLDRLNLEIKNNKIISVSYG